MTPTMTEIRAAAQLLYDEWRRQVDRAPTEEEALRKKYGVVEFTFLDPDEGYDFVIGETRYSASWYGELYYDGGVSLPDPVVSPDDVAAAAFAADYSKICESYYTAVHCAAESLGWYWSEDDEFNGRYYHPDSETVIVVPHGCKNLDEIEFREEES